MTPKEAYKLLSKYFPNHLCMGLSEGMVVIECEQTIEQALTEHEKQTQILKILKEKVVDIWEILNSVDYNDWLVCYKPTNKKYLLTKEEFDLLKEWLNEN